MAYDIYYKGDILDSHQLADVRQNIKALFKADDAKLEQLFSGKPQLIKKDIDKATALKYQQAMKNAGAKPIIKEASSAAPSPEPTEQAASPPPAAASEQQAAPKQTMAERLAAMEAEAPAAASQNPDGDASYKIPTADTIDDSMTGGLVLSPEGTEVLKADERKEFVPLDLDTSAMSVAEAGADINPEPKADTPSLDLDLSGLDLDELGATLVTPKTVEQRSFDHGDLSVAEPGAIIETLEKPAAPPAPDTSSLSLKD